MTKKKPHILVVDDELSMRELLEIMFGREGYKALTNKLKLMPNWRRSDNFVLEFFKLLQGRGIRDSLHCLR
jgi:DNA-binding NtrC family response regulator